MPARDVVISGMGCVCPLGIGTDALWAAFEAGRSGVAWLDELKGIDSPFRFAARIKDFDAKLYVQPRKTIKVMCQEIQTAFASAGMAMEQGGLAKGAIDPERIGVVLGSEMMYGDLPEIVDVFRHCSRDGKPAGASRPFEARRSGIVLGEGAGMLLLEAREHAERRGAKILARIAGYASRHEAPGNPWTVRSGRAIEQSIAAALATAEMQP